MLYRAEFAHGFCDRTEIIAQVSKLFHYIATIRRYLTF